MIIITTIIFSQNGLGVNSTFREQHLDCGAEEKRKNRVNKRSGEYKTSIDKSIECINLLCSGHKNLYNNSCWPSTHSACVCGYGYTHI